ncbi:efflux RND transporter periplasmic adaptor subunit [Dyella acidiphila]|uniref:Efflux RND transporter periplasmic adaptor subunit n=1 Tax=Dyella acidiphila TaxID=2775866 RepID=A0ABR9G9E3_9GAMM|nr:efflux RND transporter periplasmic adaptor subunit [Dyella acidiphila]MBE1160655.1 efflux RND transporter periplasmic adaptor subunit [Dyella acidiphila]
MTPRRLRLMLFCAAACIALAVWHLLSGGGHASAKAAASDDDDSALTVSAITVQASPWQGQVKAFGQLRAAQGSDLSAEVSGIVDSIDFKSGQNVQAGTVLLRLRPNDDDAKLAALRANAELAAANLARDRQQYALKAISRATLDQDEANEKNAHAQVAAQQAQMAEKVVRAPFSGQLGIRMVDLGQYLTAGTPIVSLQALDPIYLDFNLPQQQLGQVRPGQSVDVAVDSFPGKLFKAQVMAVDSRVDAASRMVAVRADLDNPGHVLLPGMFATARLSVGQPEQVLAIPLAAISFSPHGDYVYVLTPKSGSDHLQTASMRALHVGEQHGDRAIVLDGLTAGEVVVTAGQIKLRNGATVQINNSAQPSDRWHPDAAEE